MVAFIDPLLSQQTVTPASPGSSLVTTLIVLNAIGLGPNASAGIALLAGIDRALDMCRTAVNTFSNLVGTAVVARAEGERVRVLRSSEATSQA